MPTRLDVFGFTEPLDVEEVAFWRSGCRRRFRPFAPSSVKDVFEGTVPTFQSLLCSSSRGLVFLAGAVVLLEDPAVMRIARLAVVLLVLVSTCRSSWWIDSDPSDPTSNSLPSLSWNKSTRVEGDCRAHACSESTALSTPTCAHSISKTWRQPGFDPICKVKVQGNWPWIVAAGVVLAPGWRRASKAFVDDDNNAFELMFFGYGKAIEVCRLSIGAVRSVNRSIEFPKVFGSAIVVGESGVVVASSQGFFEGCLCKLIKSTVCNQGTNDL